MIRMFETNKVRSVNELDGTWKFRTLDISGVYGEELDLNVPGCWDHHPQLLGYRGSAQYTRMIQVEKTSNIRFQFKGVSHTAKVFFNGREIARHYNAYTAFDAIALKVAPGSYELRVEVDNSFGEHSALHIENDYFTYGGITRPVAMELIGDIFIERLQFTPFYKEGQWGANIEAIIRNVTATAHRIQVKGSLCGQDLHFASYDAPPGRSNSSINVMFPEAKSWSGIDPILYHLHTYLYSKYEAFPIDDLIERVGFRTVSTDKGAIQINGENIILLGFNRHEDHPAVGSAIPPSLMAHDLDLMADMGVNCVRTSHYPNDERFLDLCDERGFYVWEENHARGLSLDDMRHPLFAQQCEAVNREMVEQHVNHPSILTWGILNECASDTEEGRVHYKRQLEQIRKLDGSRPLTFASHHREKELCFDLVDIVSMNLYPGWYTDEDPSELADKAKGWAEAAGGAGKPFILSEFGADGYYGYRDRNGVRGTEELQAEIIEANLSAYVSKPYLSGMLIWQFCDCRVTESTGWLLTRAGTQNSKGIVDRYRRPKLAYDVVRKYFRASR